MRRRTRGPPQLLLLPKDRPMSNAQDYRNKAAEFARLATEATSPTSCGNARARSGTWPKTRNGWRQIKTRSFRTERPLTDGSVMGPEKVIRQESSKARRIPPPPLMASQGKAHDMSKVTATGNPQSDTSQHAATIARWDDEGGASGSSPHKGNAGPTRHPAPKCSPNNNNKDESHAT